MISVSKCFRNSETIKKVCEVPKKLFKLLQLKVSELGSLTFGKHSKDFVVDICDRVYVFIFTGKVFCTTVKNRKRKEQLKILISGKQIIQT